MELENSLSGEICTSDILSHSKESEVENVDAIKKYIQEQEQEILLKGNVYSKEPKSEMDIKSSGYSGNVDTDDANMPEDSLSEILLNNTTTEESTTKQCSDNDCIDQESEETSEIESKEISNTSTTQQHIQKNVKTKRELQEKLESDEKHQMKDSPSKQNKNQHKSHVNVKLKIEESEKIKTVDNVKSEVSDLDKRHDVSGMAKSDPNSSVSISNTDINDLINAPKVPAVSKEHLEESLTIASSVMNMILQESEAIIENKKKVNSSVSLAVGSKVEAKDFCELWYPAQIIEVDYDEMEVLVQYDNQPKKHNEWISVSSPRLRPIGSNSELVAVPTVRATTVIEADTPDVVVKEESKVDEKPKLTFTVGERCLARWRDNRRFIATINNDLGCGTYEVMFDDGSLWKCTLSRLYKLKESCGKNDYPTFGTRLAPAASLHSTSANATPNSATPGTNGLPLAPVYHTHLFDPTCDYLGSKSERREKKRKLNIKEIFNIGQKRKKQSLSAEEMIKQEEIKSESSPRESEKPIMEPIVDLNPPLDTIAKIETKSLVQIKAAVKKKPKSTKRPFVRKKIKLKIIHKPQATKKKDGKKGLPDAVAAIIGTVCSTEQIKEENKLEVPPPVETKDSNANDIKMDDNVPELNSTNKQDVKEEVDTPLKNKGDIKQEIFESEDNAKQVMIKTKEVITKLEDEIDKVEKADSLIESKNDTKLECVEPLIEEPIPAVEKKKSKKVHSKVKKGKKLRIMQEKKVKKQVEKVKSQLEEMKKQVAAMRKQMFLKTDELGLNPQLSEMPPCYLLPGEWACKWVDGQPVGVVSEIECEAKPGTNTKPPLPRRSVQVEDSRLPPGWTKHMVRRSLGHSAGKWDVVLVSPENRRFHTKNDMRHFLENNRDKSLKPYEATLMDFGIHLKLSRRLGWVSSTSEGALPPPLPAGILSSTSPLVKRRKLSLNKNNEGDKKRRPLKIKIPRPVSGTLAVGVSPNSSEGTCPESFPGEEATLDGASITDGFVYVGSLKVEVIETLLRCPADGCFKNFRNTMLLKMHIKHYHRDLRKMMGVTPKVLDLAYARNRLSEAAMKQLKCEAQQRVIKVKLPRINKRIEEVKSSPKEMKTEPMHVDLPPTTPTATEQPVPKPQDSPKLRNALVNKPVKRPKVLLPVKRLEPEDVVKELSVPSEDCLHPEENGESGEKLIVPIQPVPECDILDFETAISTHTVNKLVNGNRHRCEKRRKVFATIPKRPVSEDDEWTATNSDVDTRSSYASCGTPDSKIMDARIDALMQPVSSETNEDPKNSSMYMYTENGERIKIVHMKREEIINCHCGFREEDGLMVQCELCLCWQHALCHNIQRESEVPEKYTCSICLNPRRGRRRLRFLHDQDRLYEGLLPGTRPCEALRRSHELSGNLLRIEDALHAVRINTYVAIKKNHPKLYLWAKDWGSIEFDVEDKLRSDNELNAIINSLDKENLPLKLEDIKEMSVDIKTPPLDEQERFSPRDNQLGTQPTLSGLLSSPGSVSLDLPISASDIEKLAKSVQEQVVRACPTAPQPEVAIDNNVCRERLLRHIQRCHALLDQKLDSIEAHVAELESQDASLEDDETAEFYPRTKQTIQMIMRDLDTMEELGVIT